MSTSEHERDEANISGDGQEHVDQDLLLARALQEQERAFYELVASSAGGSYGQESSHYAAASSASMGDGSEVDDEELARRLQSEEDQQGLQYHMQGLAGLGFEFDDAEELDYDRLGYEEWNAIGDVAGKVSKGLQPDAIQKLPQMQVKQLQQQCACSGGTSSQSNSGEQQQRLAHKAYAVSSICTICQCDYESEDMVKLLPCGHLYHQECVDQWLGLNKTCPICNKEVSCSQETADVEARAEAAQVH